MKRSIIAALLTGLLSVPLAWSQDEEKVVPKVYEIKWRSASEIEQLVLGFRGYIHNIAHSDSFKTLTVTATEKGHAVIAELIRKYDVPAKTIEFQFYLVKASASGEGIKDGLPDKIRKVLNEVAALTRYKSFEMLDAPTVRISEGKKAGLSGKVPYFYYLDFGEGIAIVTMEQGKRQIRVNEFGINFAVPSGYEGQKPLFREVGVHTSFSLGDGETIVVGASQIQEEAKSPGAAIIIVVTAKILD